MREPTVPLLCERLIPAKHLFRILLIQAKGEMMPRTAFLCPPECLFHDTGPHHPERAARIAAIQDRVREEMVPVFSLSSEPAKEEDLLRVHTRNHIDRVRAHCVAEEELDADTPVCSRSWEAALHAAGAGIAAARAILENRTNTAFCAVRPPGHHAERDKAMGFCLFNNVAVVARWLQQVGGLTRIAIIDWDVHHGNGTQQIFYDDPNVFYASIHQFPHYPGTGTERECGSSGTILNIPMEAGVSPEKWVSALRERIVPACKSFEPEFLLLSCGFDAHRLDPLSDQRLDETHFRDMTEALRDLGCRRILSLLEGGYHLNALASSAVAHLCALGKLNERDSA